MRDPPEWGGPASRQRQPAPMKPPVRRHRRPAQRHRARPAPASRRVRSRFPTGRFRRAAPQDRGSAPDRRRVLFRLRGGGGRCGRRFRGSRWDHDQLFFFCVDAWFRFLGSDFWARFFYVAFFCVKRSSPSIANAIPFDAEAAERGGCCRGDMGMMTKLLAGVDIGDVDLDHGNAGCDQRVVDRNRRVAIAAGIDDDSGSRLRLRLMNPVDEVAFLVGLAENSGIAVVEPPSSCTAFRRLRAWHGRTSQAHATQADSSSGH